MDIRKLQRAVVDALEDVKAQDIKVFNTTEQTSLFDRVVIASGTSNRQTRALASSVADKALELGVRVIAREGDDTGEWVLVDIGDIVIHIMQPAIREYYNLEEIWGSKPVRMKADDDTLAARTPKTVKTSAKKVAKKAVKKAAKKVAKKATKATKTPRATKTTKVTKAVKTKTVAKTTVARKATKKAAARRA